MYVCVSVSVCVWGSVGSYNDVILSFLGVLLMWELFDERKIIAHTLTVQSGGVLRTPIPVHRRLSRGATGVSRVVSIRGQRSRVAACLLTAVAVPYSPTCNCTVCNVNQLSHGLLCNVFSVQCTTLVHVQTMNNTQLQFSVVCSMHQIMTLSILLHICCV